MPARSTRWPARRCATGGTVARQALGAVLSIAAVLAAACGDPLGAPGRRSAPSFSYTNYASSLTASFRVATVGPAAGQAVTFDATASAGPQTLTSFEWTWGDGTPGATRATQLGQVHTFTAPGTYPVTLKITDATGATASVTQNVTIGGAGQGSGFVMNVANPVQGQYVRFTALGANLNAPGVKILWKIGSGIDTGVTTGLVKVYGSNRVQLIVQHPGAPAQLFDSTVRVTTTGPNIPYDMGLWLRGDKDLAADGAGAVTQWKDQSGNDSHATPVTSVAAPAPTRTSSCVNALACVSFSGRPLVVPWAPGLQGATVTYFIVTQPRVLPVAGDYAAPLSARCQSPTCPDYQGYNLYVSGGSSGANWQGWWSASKIGSNWSADTTRRGTATTAPALVESGYGAPGSYVSVNGVLGSRTPAFAGYAPSSLIPLMLGSMNYSGAYPLTGDIAEVLVYPRALSSAESQRVADYLAQKYALPAPVLFKWMPGDRPAGMSFARASEATYVDAGGVLRTAAAGELRDSHYDQGVRSALIEGPATNYLLASADLSNAAVYAPENATVVANSHVAPDGTAAADAIMETSTTGTHGVAITLPDLGTRAITLSFYVRGSSAWKLAYLANGGTQLGTAEINTCRAGTMTGSVVVAVPSAMPGWCRVSFSYTTAGGQAMILFFDPSSGTTLSYAGTAGAVAAAAWGVQYEDGRTATSYIPTASAAASRAGDVLRFPVTFAPQPMTFYLDNTAQNEAAAQGPSIALVGTPGTTDAPRVALGFNGTSPQAASFGAYNGAWTLASTQLTYPAGSPYSPRLAAPGERREMVGTFRGDGSLSLGVYLNGTFQSASNGSGATLPASYPSTTVLAIGGFSTGTVTPNDFANLAVRSVKVVAGERDVTTLRSY